MDERPLWDPSDADDQVDPTEGVRLIGADEAAEALERGEVAARRGDGTPRHGDRPASSGDAPRPALRFPLGRDDSSVDLVRPKVSAPSPVPGPEMSGAGPQRRSSSQAQGQAGADAPTLYEEEDDADDSTMDPDPVVILDDAGPSDDDPSKDRGEGVAAGSRSGPPPDLPVEPQLAGDDATGGGSGRAGPVEDSGAAGDEEPHAPAASGRWATQPLDLDDADLEDVPTGEEEAPPPDLGEPDGAADPVAVDEPAEVARPAPDQRSVPDPGREPEPEPQLRFDPEPEPRPAPRPQPRPAPRSEPVEPLAGAVSEPTSAGPEAGDPGTPPGAVAADRSGATGDDGGEVPPPRDVRLAVISGVGLAAAALGLFMLGEAAATVLVVVIAVVASAELFSALRRGGFQPATLLGLVATGGLVAATYWRGEVAVPIVLGLTVVVAFLWYLIGVTRTEPIMNAGVSMLAISYVGLLASFATLLLRTPDGRGLLGGAIIAVVANDVCALVVGRRFGKRLIAPNISPAKTLEGFVGGGAASVVVSVVLLGSDVSFLGLHPWTIGSAAILGVVVAVMAPLGDLCESMIKRDLGIKDMSAVIPGHGGVLDRVDALLFCLPAVYYVAMVLDLL